MLAVRYLATILVAFATGACTADQITPTATGVARCVECTNYQTEHMKRTGQTCADSSFVWETRCTNEGSWWADPSDARNTDVYIKYCQYTCWQHGVGYPDNDAAPCCPRDESAPDDPVPTSFEEFDSDQYVPGHLTQSKLGVRLSNGLDLRIIARSGQTVEYANGTVSAFPFHLRPDYGATFEVPNDVDGGWVYLSNSEIRSGGGGVGRLTFDKDANVVGYDMLLLDTDRNCGGGKTQWDTFISCEESGNGHCHQLDPFGGLVQKEHSRTALGGLEAEGGNFESFAYDERDVWRGRVPTFFVTEDRRTGALRRFRPSPDNVDWNDPGTMLHDQNGAIDYLVIVPHDNDGRAGTYYWTTDKDEGKLSAELYYQNSEGIDAKDGMLYFTARKNMDIYILDLDDGTFERKNVPEEGFALSSDQIIRLAGDDSGLIYLTNHGWMQEAAGVYARDAEGRYFTILDSPIYNRLSTGLAFSPDAQHMYMCFQEAGIVFDVWRKDGQSFGGQPMSIKHHM